MNGDKFRTFIHNSREIMDSHLGFKKRLEKVMGAVADLVVKDKYVNKNDVQEVPGEDNCDEIN